jgi:hypothetical protein
MSSEFAVFAAWGGILGDIAVCLGWCGTFGVRVSFSVERKTSHFCVLHFSIDWFVWLKPGGSGCSIP